MPLYYKGKIQQHNDRSYKSLDNCKWSDPNSTLIFPLSPCIILVIYTFAETNAIKLNQSECNTLSVPLTSSQSDYLSESSQSLSLFPVPVYPDPCKG